MFIVDYIPNYKRKNFIRDKLLIISNSFICENNNNRLYQLYLYNVGTNGFREV